MVKCTHDNVNMIIILFSYNEVHTYFDEKPFCIVLVLWSRRKGSLKTFSYTRLHYSFVIRNLVGNFSTQYL